MLSKKDRKTLLGNLPENWKAETAERFEKSVSYIEKVAYGSIENLEIFEYLVTTAETHKARALDKLSDLKTRIQNLGKPISA